MRAAQTSRYIYNEDGKRISLPLDLETEWNEFMRMLRRKRKG